MSILNTILQKLGLQKPAAPAPAAPAAPATVAPEPSHDFIPAPPPSTPPMGMVGSPTMAPGGPMVPPPSAAPAAPAPMAMVDVMGHLEALAAANPVKPLNWKQSINDLMFLLGLPHTPDDIRELAVELGCPENLMGDSYSRNVWTYDALMKKIAENGGNVPPALLK